MLSLIRIIEQNTKILTSRFYCSEAKKLNKKIGFIGDGNMAKAMCKSFANNGLIKYSQVTVSSPYIKNLNIWKELGANVTTNNTEVVTNSDIIFIAVKPHLFNEAIGKVIEDSQKNAVKDKLFVSILAGITLQELEEKMAPIKGCRIIRVMPNTPMVVSEGCTVYCPGRNATKEDLGTIKKMLEVTGYCEQIPEKILNAIGAIASSGPAYVYLFIEALSDGGVRMGLHREQATRIAAQTVLGASKMVLKTNKHMGTLKDEVCSAGGTTIAGIHALEKGAVRGAVMNAVEAAANRALELAK